MTFCAPQSSTGVQEHDKDQEFATIGQAQPTGGSLPLESVESEERIVREHVQTAEVTKLSSSESTRDVALVLVVSSPPAGQNPQMFPLHNYLYLICLV
ncbi:hypothetical protein M378DRAFT_170693 [Amanita muscaria Koide BX008]|uniref:Uncharacterized protein n=1 Tax=Amanita muscaria (strain Koide BX008) TaxID=946122 RepID=A0A0C2S6H4_AMAMK|nr:hypothetical protein M378DRAFT_170693 [Amanita muscaria Koide BX008]